jgi:CheY-like chemotaxis protein
MIMGKILIIEDIANNLDSIRNALSDLGPVDRKDIYPHFLEQQDFIGTFVYSITHNDTKGFVEFIKRTIKENNICSLIIDLNLNPIESSEDIMDTDGMKLVRSLKEDQEFKDKKIVILSVREDIEEIPNELIVQGVLPLRKPTAVDPDAVSRLFKENVINFLASE